MFSIEINLLLLAFPFKLQRNLLIRKTTIEINLLSIHLNLISIDFPFEFQKKNAPKVLCTIGYHPNNYIIEDLGHSWGTGTPSKIVWVLFFDTGLIKHLIIWETLHFQGFNIDMAFWSKWTSFFLTPKVCVHNRVPSKQLHYWGSGPFMGYWYPLENCLGAVFWYGFNKASNYLGNLAFSRL